MDSASYFISFFWGIFILLAFIGWGSLLKSVFFFSKEVDWAQRAAWGVALTIFIGGVLNFCWAISPFIIWVYIGAGFLCLLLDLHNIKSIFMNVPQRLVQLWQQDKITLLAILSIVLLIILYYSTWINAYIFHSDDWQAYAVFPQKMLQQGSLGYEPFSDRRTSALGGQSFLHVLVLSLLHINNLKIIDPGIAYIIAFGLLWNFSKAVKISRKSALLVMFFFLLIPPPSKNLTSLIMGLALFLALFINLECQISSADNKRAGYNFITALLAAAICASKSNLIVFCGVFLIIFYLLRLSIQSSKRTVVIDCFNVILLTIIFLLPWLISSFVSSGTMLYPLLGRGYHRSAYGFTEYPPITWELFTDIFYRTFFNGSMLFILLLYLGCIKKVSKHRNILISAICFSVFLGVFIINLLNPQCNIRYSFSFYYASLTILLMYILFKETVVHDFKNKIYIYGTIMLVMTFFLKDYFLKPLAFVWRDAYPKVEVQGHEATVQPFFSKNTCLIYYNIQQSIPSGEAVIAKCQYPFLLDYKRNKIYIVDFLILGPKPGLPVFEGGEAVARYLLSQKIRYIIYSYGGFDGQNRAIYLKWMQSRGETLWVKQQFLFTLRFQDDLEELGKTRDRIYDDGNTFVIDLSSRPKVLKQ